MQKEDEKMSLVNKVKNKVIIVHFGSILLYPPTITLVKNLIDEEYEILVVSEQTDTLMELYKDNKKVSFENINSLKVLSSVSVESSLFLIWWFHCIIFAFLVPF